MKKLAILSLCLALVPLGAMAQDPDRSDRSDRAGRSERRERAERRMHLARTLGLAEALDLDSSQALRLGEVLARFDDRRATLATQMTDAREVLRKAARNGKATAAEVDGAMTRLFEARAQLAQLDRETVQTIAKDLSPEKRARVVLFLSRFQDRVGRMKVMHLDDRHGPGRGEGRGGHGVRMRIGGPGGEVLGLVGPGIDFQVGAPELCPPDEDCLGFEEEFELELE